MSPNYPSLYQINTRVWLTEISQNLGRRATLDDIADVELDHLAEMGFDWIWFLSVWSTGEAARKVSRETLNGAVILKKLFPICRIRISPVQGLPSQSTQSTPILGEMKP